ncbi:transmembrane emp24 domain-containing protein 10 [Elysia marginata]|uniref:Transmembrane emp24 domain-containing protein 10 n=1 Tax=Elysia marginata TaxID=1093978 RepID=A0AAV4JBF9_9GAST|nr:transmembrane emp24 domain-containing protein 10 [Elysia marginata]
MGSFVFSVALLTICIFNAEAVKFMLASGGRKCLKEEIHKDVLVTGEYDIQDNGQRVDVTVTDSRGHILASKESAVHGKFAFTTEEYDMFEVCVTSKSASGEAI